MSRSGICSRVALMLIGLLAAEAQSLASSGESIVPMNFVGEWSGHLSIRHSPFSSTEADNVHYRFQISNEHVRLFINDNEQQLWEDPYLSSKMDTHLLMVVSRLGPAWTEDLAINLVWLGEGFVYAYVSRVVSNFSLSQDDNRRHYPVFLAGRLTKDSN